MKTFAVIAVRLIGLWFIAGSSSGIVLTFVELLRGTSGMWGGGQDFNFLVVIASVWTPVLAGLALIPLSRPVAALVMAGVATDSPAPNGVTVRGFTQIGVFLVGLHFALAQLPVAIAALFGRMGMLLDQWIAIGLGVLLMASALFFGKLVDWARQRD